MAKLTISLAVLGAATGALAKVLSPLPPMGFNDWSRYMGALNQSLFTDTADAMVEKGLLRAGYNRINLDDEWSTMDRLANKSMIWDTDKFPKGLPWLTAHLKKQGFIPGIYTDAGTLSCGGFPGAYGYEDIDAQTFADWGFEYVKLDGCNMPDSSEGAYRKVYKKWSDALTRLPSPMVFSQSAPAYFAEAANLTDWYAVMNWVPQYGQLARHSRDTLVWNSTKYWPDITGWDSVMFNYGQEVRLARFQRPGYVNDPDFLNVDHFDYSMDEKRSHFALWASFSAPLILSTDVLALTDEDVAYLTNADIIAVDQDPLVQQATLVRQSATWDVLTKSLYNGDRLVTVLNKGNKTASMTVPWSHIGLSPDTLATPSTLNLKNLWTGKMQVLKTSHDAGVTARNVPKHGTALFRLSHPTPGNSVRTTPTGIIFNTFSLHCLTDAPHRGGKTTWTNCTGADAQTWRVRPDGTISSLLDEKRCLVSDYDNVISTDCKHRQAVWDYFVSGNLVNRDTKRCLTEGSSSKASQPAEVKACGYLTNEQVLALPVGVAI